MMRRLCCLGGRCGGCRARGFGWGVGITAAAAWPGRVVRVRKAGCSRWCLCGWQRHLCDDALQGQPGTALLCCLFRRPHTLRAYGTWASAM
jgi:hypothetical protein